MNNTIGARPPLRLLAAVALVAVAGCATQTPRNTALSAIDETLAPPTERKAMPVVPPAVREELVRAMPIAPPESWLPEVRFDLAVSNAPAAQVFLAIASDSRYSMLLPPDLPGTITINLKDVTVREALDALRELYGYEYRIDGKRVYVMPQGLQTRIFRVNYLDIKRQGQSDMRVSSGSLDRAPPSDRAAGATVASVPSRWVVRGLAGSRVRARPASSSPAATPTSGPCSARRCSTIVGTEGGRNVVVNPLAGVIVVRATAAEHRQIEEFLRAMQVSVERQVMLEAKIVEVSLRDGFQSGINWAAFDSAGSTAPRWAVTPVPIGTDRIGHRHAGAAAGQRRRHRGRTHHARGCSAWRSRPRASRR